MSFNNLPLVRTMHILNNGEIIDSFEAYEKVCERFSWVDKRELFTRLLKLRSLTDDWKGSFIVIYEADRQIREYINVDQAFRPLAFC
jgi:RNA polymerase subunit RPABC4/transcription elongation factor Spt4